MRARKVHGDGAVGGDIDQQRVAVADIAGDAARHRDRLGMDGLPAEEVAFTVGALIADLQQASLDFANLLNERLAGVGVVGVIRALRDNLARAVQDVADVGKRLLGGLQEQARLANVAPVLVNCWICPRRASACTEPTGSSEGCSTRLPVATRFARAPSARRSARSRAPSDGTASKCLSAYPIYP